MALIHLLLSCTPCPNIPPGSRYYPSPRQPAGHSPGVRHVSLTLSLRQSYLSILNKTPNLAGTPFNRAVDLTALAHTTGNVVGLPSCVGDMNKTPVSSIALGFLSRLLTSEYRSGAVVFASALGAVAHTACCWVVPT